MNRTKITLIAIALSCIGLLSFALYLQIVEKMLPCPLCVLQRYAFLAVLISCLIALAMPRALHRIGFGLGLASALSGIGVAGYHVWVLANPTVSCGIDPLETGLNKIFLAEALPTFFKADGLCDTPYPPIFGLSIPAWALIWFVIFALILGVTFFAKKKARELFGKGH
jgi:disulfide bond formation protein DsbB